ncbi:hypothetical protein [Rufibacter quisquiliarum]|uniref:Uncharacterized protein n=1 Tax=Rufibacter quisquiliarum TaxID=1549639 RepID=A0A839GMH8_9BACT|nr:hypothetical protein [Rufibacter quisquiliarum]MBA9079083.1 hypothetical protein [Rufibacter quisquiliarum]
MLDLFTENRFSKQYYAIRMKSENKSSWGMVGLFALLHLICCGLPLLLLSGLSLLMPSWPVIGIAVAVLGIVGFIWYLKRGCATCPRNEGRCLSGCKNSAPGNLKNIKHH